MLANDINTMSSEAIINGLLQGYIKYEQILNINSANKLIDIIERYPASLSMVRFVLKNIECEKITSEILNALIDRFDVTPAALQLFLAHINNTKVTTEVLISYINSPRITSDILEFILEKIKNRRVDIRVRATKVNVIDPVARAAYLERGDDIRVITAIAGNVNSTPVMLKLILMQMNKMVTTEILVAIASNSQATSEILQFILEQIDDGRVDVEVLEAVAANPNSALIVHRLILEKAHRKIKRSVFESIAANTYVTSTTLHYILQNLGTKKFPVAILVIIAENPNTPPDILQLVLDKAKNEENYIEIFVAVAINPQAAPGMIQAILERAITKKEKIDSIVLRYMASNPKITPVILGLILRLESDNEKVDFELLIDVAKSSQANLVIFEVILARIKLIDDEKSRLEVFAVIAGNPQIDPGMLQSILEQVWHAEDNTGVLMAIAGNPKVASDTLQLIFEQIISNEKINVQMLEAIAKNPQAAPEILQAIFALTKNGKIIVNGKKLDDAFMLKAIASNPNTSSATLRLILDFAQHNKVAWRVLAVLVNNPNCNHEVMQVIKNDIIASNNPDRFKFFASILNPEQLTTLVEELLEYCGSSKEKIAKVFADHPIRDLVEALDGRVEVRSRADHQDPIVVEALEEYGYIEMESYATRLIRLYSSNEILARQIKLEYLANKSEIETFDPLVKIAVVDIINTDARMLIKKQVNVVAAQPKLQQANEVIQRNLEVGLNKPGQ